MSLDSVLPLAELYDDGGFIIVGIFMLSVYLYVTAFRSLIATARIARLYSSADDLVKEQQWQDEVDEPWRGFLADLSEENIDKVDTRSRFEQARKRLSRSANADLLRLKISIAAAPLLGLLGTIIGMIDTFDAIGLTSTADTSAMVARGISKALITTSAGLMVALPALFITFIIRRKLRQAMVVTEVFESAVLKGRRVAAS